jgi:hypothetical protein
MQKLAILMIVAVTTFEFFVKGDHWGRWALLPKVFQYAPEFLGLMAAMAVIFLGTRNRFQHVRPQYWLVFGALVISIVCGIIVNSVPAGPIFAGIRLYLRAMAWFLVPAVFAFSDAQLRTQLRVLLLIAVLQLPLAIQQRWTTMGQGKVTGDWTSGTLLISSMLSIFLIGGMCIAAAMYVGRRITRGQFVILMVLLFFPTTINETKGTLVLLPVGVLITFMATAPPGRRLKGILVASGLLTAAVALYVPVYDYLVQDRKYALTLSEYLENPDRLEAYLWRKEDVGTTGKGGRVDSVLVPIRQLLKDPVHLAFGFGIGNASDSALGRGFVGEQYSRFAPFLITAFARLLLEIGLVGFVLVLALFWLIYKDARVVASRSEGMRKSIAGGMAGITVVVVLSTVYKDVIASTPLSFLFWYLAGIVAAARMSPVTPSTPALGASNGTRSR